MVWAFAKVWRRRPKHILLVTGTAAMVQMVITAFVVRQITVTGAGIFYGYFMVGISYLYRGGRFEVSQFYTSAYLFGELLTLLAAGAVVFGRSRPGRKYIFLMFMVLELLLAVHVETVYLEPFKKAAFRDSRLVDKIHELQRSDPAQGTFPVNDRDVIYMDGDVRAYVGILQFMARDMDIQVMERREAVSDYKEDITGKDILIFAFDDIFWQEWEEQYDHVDTYGHFTVLYN